MKLKILAISILSWLFNITYAQTIDDMCKITLGVYFPDGITQETKNLRTQLEDRLVMFATQTGFSSFKSNSFFISPNIIINSIDIAEGGMKNIYVVKGALYLAVQGETDGIVYSSASFPFNGSAAKQETAIKNGVLNINYDQVKNLFVDAKKKILVYYESKKNIIFAHADMCVSNGEYDEAIACLMLIPEELNELHIQAVCKAQEIYDMRDKAIYLQMLKDKYNSNDSVLKEANSLLAMHNAQDALKVLWHYRSGDNEQDGQYNKLIRKAESLVSASEREALKREKQAYMDSKQKEEREWKEYTTQTAHERDMDIRRIKLNSKKVEAVKTIACEFIRRNPYRYNQMKF